MDWYWCRDGGLPRHDFRRLGVWAEKEFWSDLSSALKKVLKKIIFLAGDLFERIFGMLHAPVWRVLVF